MSLKNRRDKLWREDPHCRNCGILTIPPDYLPQTVGKDGRKSVKNAPDNMATIQHIYGKLSPLRRKKVDGERTTLWCFRCNHIEGTRGIIPEPLPIKRGIRGFLIKLLEKLLICLMK